MSKCEKRCINCIHCDVCKNDHRLKQFDDYQIAEYCTAFKDRSLFVELPFRFMQTVYDITEFVEGFPCPDIYELKDSSFYVEKDREGELLFTYDGVDIRYEDIGKTIFLTKEDAEKKLKEIEGK